MTDARTNMSIRMTNSREKKLLLNLASSVTNTPPLSSKQSMRRYLMPTPERNLWLRLKAAVPKGTHLTRIENRAGSGVPDSLMAHLGRVLFCELKCTKGDTVSIRPSQIAWNMQYSRAGGVSFFLVSTASKPDLFLFAGGDAVNLNEKGLKFPALWRGTDLASCALFMFDRAGCAGSGGLAPCD